MRILVAHASLSGNTRDLAQRVRARCEARGHRVIWIETDLQDFAAAGADARHDLYLLGSWTGNGGRTPPEMKRFIAGLVDAVGKPPRVAAFGTGETQWGAESYCGAVRRMAAFFASPFPLLEIEQMPHGQRDATRIDAWTDLVIGMAPTIADDTFPSRPKASPRHEDPARHVR